MLYIMLAAAYPFGRPEDENLKPAKKMHVMLQVLLCPCSCPALPCRALLMPCPALPSCPCPALRCPALPCSCSCYAHSRQSHYPALLCPACPVLAFALLAVGHLAPALATSLGLACPAGGPACAAFPVPALAVSPT